MRILSWNVNGLYTTLKDAAVRHSSISNYFSNVLNADIICFQEAKVQEEKLEKWMACVPGYESFWAFSKDKKGYSGVVTYVKEELSPLDAKANWLGDFDDPLLEEFCNEGRIVETDHGSFILINVYTPNAGDREQGRPRVGFKMSFLKALKRKCDELIHAGRHIILVGDLNVPHKDQDVHRRWNIREIYSAEELSFMDALFDEYVDLFRKFHPNDEDVFSVWNQKKEARIHNEGLRIDYAVCDQGFLPHVSSTDIIKMYPKNWSDHAAVLTTLTEQPILPPHPKPAISSSNMQKFMTDARQKRLTSLFSPCLSREAKQERPVNADDDEHEHDPSATVIEESVKLDMVNKKREGTPSLAESPASKTQRFDLTSTTSRTPPNLQKNQRSLMSYLQRGDG
ncbi:hypothetical protein GOP47_0022584 [Adiantum capillus-veneris]|uniref:DNA-(apurinic or apyrimidinic site) endonuclease n=1 Tax=Adiantum capillus-veneris TaxID=13818 RepID=A0A9D4U640_ADICA|nr:hypothetical protein GOP47_0022584 [Adiantum capillus-veneris]